MHTWLVRQLLDGRESWRWVLPNQGGPHPITQRGPAGQRIVEDIVEELQAAPLTVSEQEVDWGHQGERRGLILRESELPQR